MKTLEAAFDELVAARLGLRLQPAQRLRLEGVARRTGFTTLADLYEALSATAHTSEPPWQMLVTALAVRDSYFFRDRTLFAELRQHVLPSLVARRGGERNLSVWSAGCGTGEEAYSVAMVVEEALALAAEDRAGWDVRILATDVDSASIEKARVAVYGGVALRNVSPELKRAWFKTRSGQYEVSPHLREQVTFASMNLLSDDPGTARFDLIVCRNVLAALDRTVQEAVARRLAEALRPHGCLVTGRGELGNAVALGLQPVFLPGVTVWQARATPPGHVPRMVPAGHPATL